MKKSYGKNANDSTVTEKAKGKQGRWATGTAHAKRKKAAAQTRRAGSGPAEPPNHPWRHCMGRSGGRGSLGHVCLFPRHHWLFLPWRKVHRAPRAEQGMRKTDPARGLRSQYTESTAVAKIKGYKILRRERLVTKSNVEK